MASLAEKLTEQNIKPRSYSQGEQKITCPQCSHTRRNRTDPCLSLCIEADKAYWHCHNCQWKGGVHESNAVVPYRPREVKIVRPKQDCGPLTTDILRFFAQRGISDTTLRTAGVGSARVYVPGVGGEADCIAFPSRRNGETVNYKFRAVGAKHFAQVKDAEKILFNLDGIKGAETVIITEGEIDCLSYLQVGITNVVSVPDGAPAKVKDNPSAEDRKFSFLANCAAELDAAKQIILAVDGDEPGNALAEELARRLGRERCYRVQWPTAGDAACKDANEVLTVHGEEALRATIAPANLIAYPIAGLHSLDEYAEAALTLYREGFSRGKSTGWASVDEFYTVREGELTVVTGIPNSGKSEFIDALLVNLAEQHGWRFALCSFENPPGEHIAKLVEKRMRKPFHDGPRLRMNEDQVREGIAWAQDRFFLIRADDEAPTIELVLEAARGAVLRHGIKGLVIDPYNEIEHRRPSNMTETEYVSALLGKVKRFAQNHGVHIFFVAHPAKMQREGSNIPAPTLYDISGSANWANKADCGLVVHRPDPVNEPTRSEIYVRKIRFKSVGKIGVVALNYDRATGRYAEFFGGNY